MGSSASIPKRTNKVSVVKWTQMEYVAEILHLETAILILNNRLFDQYENLKYIDDIKQPIKRVYYMKVVEKMEEIFEDFQSDNAEVLKTIDNHIVEEYWTKYIDNCKQVCITIMGLEVRTQALKLKIAEYLVECRQFRQTMRDNRAELARLTKIQNANQNEQYLLNQDYATFYRNYEVKRVNMSKIDIRSVALLSKSNVYWGEMVKEEEGEGDVEEEEIANEENMDQATKDQDKECLLNNATDEETKIEPLNSLLHTA